MPDPIVTMVVDSDGVERWGSVDAPWVKKLAEGSPAEPAQSADETQPADSSVDWTDTEPAKEVEDAAPVPADSDRPKPRSARN